MSIHYKLYAFFIRNRLELYNNRNHLFKSTLRVIAFSGIYRMAIGQKLSLVKELSVKLKLTWLPLNIRFKQCRSKKISDFNQKLWHNGVMHCWKAYFKKNRKFKLNFPLKCFSNKSYYFFIFKFL